MDEITPVLYWSFIKYLNNRINKIPNPKDAINNNRIGENPYLFPIDRLEAVDIDEESDFIIADILMNEQK